MIDPFLTQLISETRALALSYWRKGFAVETKPDRTLVTEADKAIEALVRVRIQDAYPQDGIYGEEFDNLNIDSDRVWVIDPIDGTQAFVMGVPVFSTLIAVMEQGQAVQAVADFPAMDLTFTAVRGQGAWMNGARIGVRATGDIGSATLTATSAAMFDGTDAAQFERLVSEVGSVRFGLDAYGFCALARGRADIAVEANLKPYDYMAPSLIVREAGGAMTDWAGKALTLQSDGRVVAATSPVLLSRVLSSLYHIS